MPDRTHFADRATRALAQAGFPDADPTPLTEWAMRWHAQTADYGRPDTDGVIVAADGQVVGETYNRRGYYLTDTTKSRYGLIRPGVDWALPEIRDQIGQHVAHIKAMDVAPGPKIHPQQGRLIEVMRDLADLEDERDTLIATMHADGVSVAELTRLTGLTRPTIYKRLK